MIEWKRARTACAHTIGQAILSTWWENQPVCVIRTYETQLYYICFCVTTKVWWPISSPAPAPFILIQHRVCKVISYYATSFQKVSATHTNVRKASFIHDDDSVSKLATSFLCSRQSPTNPARECEHEWWSGAAPAWKQCTSVLVSVCKLARNAFFVVAQCTYGTRKNSPTWSNCPMCFKIILFVNRYLPARNWLNLMQVRVLLYFCACNFV